MALKVKIKEKYIYPFLDVLLNGFNYGFHIYTSWYLIKQSYGVLNAYLALVSLFMVMGIALQSYNAKVSAGINLLEKEITLGNPLIISGIPSLVLILMSPLIKNLLKGDLQSVIAVAILLFLHGVLSSGRGVLQGQGEFLKLNISFYIEVITKVLFLFLFLPIFSSVITPLLSILIGYIFALIHLYLYFKKLEYKKVKWIKLREFIKSDKVKVFIFSQFFIYSYFSVDMIIVNATHSDFAAIYAVVQKLGMIQFFVGSSLMAVFLPELADNRIDFNEFNIRWKRCLKILLAVLLLFQIFYNTLFPLILPYMFGSQYLSAGLWVPYGGVIFAILVVMNFFITTLLAKGSTGFNSILFVGLIAVSLGIIFADSIGEVLVIQGCIYALVTIGLYRVINKEIFMFSRIEKSEKKTILFLSWRDIKAPKMGGAEIYTHEMVKRCDTNKYRIIHFSPLFKGASDLEIIDGVTYYRSGTVLSVINRAKSFYKMNKNSIDYVVNQCNTHRFFTPLWVKKDKRVFFIHQLTRKIWFYHASFPFNFIGYILEKPLLRLNKKDLTITVSNSTKRDLIDIGFKPENISVLPEGLSFTPWNRNDFKEKYSHTTFIYVGRFAQYKGIDDVLHAFASLKKQEPTSKLIIVGKPNMKYIEDKLNPICSKNGLSFSFEKGESDVEYKGFVSEEDKLEYMSRSHLLIFPSIREGWGLTISEAAAVGTPSLVYDAPGTKDAVLNGNAGYMVKIGDIHGLKEQMMDSITNINRYEDIRTKAHELSKTLHWDNTGLAFRKFCESKL